MDVVFTEGRQPEAQYFFTSYASREIRCQPVLSVRIHVLRKDCVLREICLGNWVVQSRPRTVRTLKPVWMREPIGSAT